MKRIGLISDTHGTFDDTLRGFLTDVDEISCDAPTVNFSPSSAKG